MLNKTLSIITIGIVRLIIQPISSAYIRCKYRLMGAHIGRNFIAYGTFTIRGWYCNVHIDKKVDIHNNSCLLVGREGIIKVGYRSSVSYNTILNAGNGKIEIGENTMIAGNCYIVANDHDIYSTISVRDSGHITRDIRIGDNVWIGANVVVTKGVTIGNGSVIGAGSVVTKNIPPMSIACGNPAKVIKTRVINDVK